LANVACNYSSICERAQAIEIRVKAGKLRIGKEGYEEGRIGANLIIFISQNGQNFDFSSKILNLKFVRDTVVEISHRDVCIREEKQGGHSV
jgi:hypothetical protein